MKKVLLLIVFIGFIGLIARGVLVYTAEKAASKPEVREKVNNTSDRINEQLPSYGLPLKLRIPKLEVNAAVESVGMDAKGNMDVPKNVHNVAWYNLGYKPGDKGSAVIAGHFDTPTGAPSVFYDLSNLKLGDEIEVVDENGQTVIFEVIDSERYDFDKVPLKEIFDSRDKPRLNLITCDGVFNKAAQIYSKRLVVYAELKE